MKIFGKSNLRSPSATKSFATAIVGRALEALAAKRAHRNDFANLLSDGSDPLRECGLVEKLSSESAQSHD